MDQSFTSTESRIGVQGSIGNHGVINFNHIGGGGQGYMSTKRRFLKMLYQSLDKNQKDRNPDRVPGTCEWFTSHQLFHDWKTSSSSKMLWVSADPGCGKSVLAKYLIDRVFTTRATTPNPESADSTPGTTTCYYFFKDDFEGQSCVTTALCCILFQLFRAKSALLSEAILEQFEIVGDGFIESFTELWSALLLAASNPAAGEIVIILDAIDECSDNSQLIRELHRLYSTQPYFNLKFLVTSRSYREIRQGFQSLKVPGSAFIHLSGEREMDKISKEIGIFVDAKVQEIGDKLKLTKPERTFLSYRFKRVPNRTYLWVYLTLDSIERDMRINLDMTKNRIVEVTSQLPKTLDEAYEGILSRSSDPEQARRLLHIVIAAERPLTVQEMNLALAINEHSLSYRSLELKPEERFRDDIRDLCGLFVTIIESKVYLFHQTAREFLLQKSPPSPTDGGILKWKHSLQLQDSHQVLAEICIQHLQFTEFEARPLNKDYSVTEYIEKNRFIDYSASNWVSHLHGSQKELTSADAIIGLCKTASKRCLTWLRIYWATVLAADFPEDITSLMVACQFGLDTVVEKILAADSKIDVNVKDSKYGRSAISWAAGSLKATHPPSGGAGDAKGEPAAAKTDQSKNEDDHSYIPPASAAQEGHKGAVQHLLLRQADKESKDKRGATPLAHAAISGYEKVVELLLSHGVEIEAKDEDGATPLIHAARHGHDKVISLLLKDGANIEARDKGNGQTPLICAAIEGHESTVRLLVDKGADRRAKDTKNKRPAIIWSIHKENDAMFRLLSADKDTQAPILYAAHNGYYAEVRMLLEKGADIETQDEKFGRTALIWATQGGNKNTAQLLIDRGANIHKRDKGGRTALSRAASSGYDAIVKSMIEKGMDLEDKDEDAYAYTALMWAAQEKREAVVHYLLEKGANIDPRDGKFSRTPLLWAARSGRDAMARILVDKGADIEAQDTIGRTPLLWAIEKGNDAIAFMLLDKGANMETKDNDGRSPLSRAALAGRDAIAQVLIDKGANIEENDNSKHGYTPLVWAAQEGRLEIVRMLLDNGANIKATDKSGRSPISRAVSSGNEAMVRLLIDRGADMEQVDGDLIDDKFGNTPILWASLEGHEGIVRLLLNKGADIEQRNKSGRTSLSRAAASGRKGVAQLLLDRNADLEAKDSKYNETLVLDECLMPV
ncbi:hypothetical protein TWF730_005702 [Orbilia blumenaviensis]|uniref:NACHT domain-containing protein n=1 Tax=Orbilia blumenaviensis TaxID=1796055 RepID=A0AAV9VJJ1_9PEZI